MRVFLAAMLAIPFAATRVEAGQPAGDIQLLVGFAGNIAPRERAATLQRAGLTRRGAVRAMPVEVVSAAASASEVRRRLAGAAGVAFVEPDTRLLPSDTTPNDPLYPVGSSLGGEWGLTKVQAPNAWDVSTGSSTTAIAVVDSGVAAAHPDLSAQVMTGYNVLDGSTNTSDTFGHGTEVAGVAAAATNNSTGIAGACWSCRLLPVKVYTDSSGAFLSNVATGVTWAADHGARVINISLAGPSSSSTLASAVSYARQRGAVVIAAAGNASCDCLTYPAATAGVIGVSASDQNDTLYSYSNFGSWVTLAAPGQNVTTHLTDPVTGAPYGYMSVGGTSMAAPLVAGVAGLLLSAAPSLTPDQVTAALTTTTDPLAGTRVSAAGRVNAARALAAATGGTPPPPPPPVSPPTNTSAPIASGIARVNQTLTATAGTWSGNPTATSYQWSRCDGSGAACVSVPGGTAATYLLSTADVGRTMRVSVTASNAAGSATAASAPTVTVVAETPSTLSFSGSLTNKITSRSFPMTLSVGTARATLSFSRCSSLTLKLTSPTGATIATASGASPVLLTAPIAAPASYAWVVSGTCRVSFGLSVTG